MLRGNKLLLLIAVLAFMTRLTKASSFVPQVCKSCKCYDFDCSRLTESDPNCQNKYRDTCDNKEDISEDDFCNVQCDCCLENQCLVWQTYDCIMYRTYEFANIVYFILIVAHFFILIRLFSGMFGRYKEFRPEDYPEQEEEELEKAKEEGKSLPEKASESDAEIIREVEVPLVGYLYLNEDRSKSSAKGMRKEIISKFMDEVSKKRPLCKKNQVFFGALVLMYFVLFLFHLINVLVLGEKPFVYTGVIWLNHLMMLVFWAGLFYTFYKVPHYQVEIRKIMDGYGDAKNVDINYHERKNAIVFKFYDNDEDYESEQNDELGGEEDNEQPPSGDQNDQGNGIEMANVEDAE
jgi:hypothetical protein